MGNNPREPTNEQNGKKRIKSAFFMQILKGVTWFSALVLFRERLIASNNNEKIKYRTKKETLRQGLMQRHILL